MDRGYGQFCPVAKAAELLCERWTMLVVRELIAGSRHFNELRRGLPLISPTLLSRRLKQLTLAGVIRRVRGAKGMTMYELTPAGGELRAMIEFMAVWGHRWVGSQFAEQDLDAGLLMWDIRRSVSGKAFPERRIVVEFHLTDAPPGMGQWWLVSDGGEVDLCREDPGHEVDIMLRSSVRTLTEVWMWRLPAQEAVRAGRIELFGAPALKQGLLTWLQGSPLVRLGADSLAADPIAV